VTAITLWKVGSETRSGRRIRPQHRGNLWYQLDLNIERDRAYLRGRGVVFVVIARGDRRGKVVSAHRTRALAELAAKACGGGKMPPKSSKSQPSLKTRRGRSNGSVATMSCEEAGALSPSTDFPYAALSKIPAMKIACARISRPPMFRT
jgi:hypothetical protein